MGLERTHLLGYKKELGVYNPVPFLSLSLGHYPPKDSALMKASQIQSSVGKSLIWDSVVGTLSAYHYKPYSPTSAFLLRWNTSISILFGLTSQWVHNSSRKRETLVTGSTSRLQGSALGPGHTFASSTNKLNLWKQYFNYYISWDWRQEVCLETWRLGFPQGSVVKSLPASAGDMGCIPDLGRSHVALSPGATTLSLCSRARELQLLSPRARSTEPMCQNHRSTRAWQPVLCDKRCHHRERPEHLD